MVRSLKINGRITVYLLENLDPAAWRASPPGGKGRDIASLFAHMISVRLMWLKAAGGTVPAIEIDKTTATVPQVRKALEESAVALQNLIAGALETDGRIKNFKPDVAAFIGYLIAHEAHHRGQISLLARLAGFPVSKQVNFGMWEWGVR